jgi:hypothetical protein
LEQPGRKARAAKPLEENMNRILSVKVRYRAGAMLSGSGQRARLMLAWDFISRGLVRLRRRMAENMAAAEASGLLADPVIARRLLG